MNGYSQKSRFNIPILTIEIGYEPKGITADAHTKTGVIESLGEIYGKEEIDSWLEDAVNDFNPIIEKYSTRLHEIIVKKISGFYEAQKNEKVDITKALDEILTGLGIDTSSSESRRDKVADIIKIHDIISNNK